MLPFAAIGRRIRFSALLATLLLSGCNFKELKGEDETADEVTIDPSAPVTFAEIQSKILLPSCLRCHSTINGRGGVKLESYAAVREHLEAIRLSTVESTRMPEGDRLSANLRALLGAWIEQGAPE